MADKVPFNEKKLTEEEALRLTAERDRPATSRETHQVEEDLQVVNDQEHQNESGWKNFMQWVSASKPEKEKQD